MPRLFLGRLAALIVACLPSFVGATAQRTFVSGNGVDNAACSLVAPCRGFAAAVTATSAGGEVIVLDSAGYGQVTITKSVSIVAPAGIYAGISVFSSPGIHVNGSGISVVLRGLTLVGQGGIGLSGISFSQGDKMTIQDCDISRMDNFGIFASAPGGVVTVRNTVLKENFIGFSADGMAAILDDVHLYANSRTGIDAGHGAKVTVTNSVVDGAGVNGLYVQATDTDVTDLMIIRSTISRSPKGVDAVSAFGGTTRVVVDNCAFNEISSTVFFFGGSPVIYALSNNSVGFTNGIVSGGVLSPLGQH